MWYAGRVSCRVHRHACWIQLPLRYYHKHACGNIWECRSCSLYPKVLHTSIHLLSARMPGFQGHTMPQVACSVYMYQQHSNAKGVLERTLHPLQWRKRSTDQSAAEPKDSDLVAVGSSETVHSGDAAASCGSTVHRVVQGKRKLINRLDALQQKCLFQSITLRRKGRQHHGPPPTAIA